ncbi:MAG: OmpH family outer membrane protein [Gemmobacter sp.]
MPQPPAPPPVLVINQDAMFEQSAFGRGAQARLEAASSALVAENREIEGALEAEERALTARRATLPPAEFRALAEAFNVKVEGIRKAQDTKSRSITRARDEDRQRFFAAAAPVLAEILRERRAVVVLDQSQVVLSLDRIDITAEAIARLDARIGSGSLSGDPPAP